MLAYVESAEADDGNKTMWFDLLWIKSFSAHLPCISIYYDYGLRKRGA
jgi:hypothetical protein